MVTRVRQSTGAARRRIARGDNSPRFPVAGGSAGTVTLSWLAPNTGAPTSTYRITASPGGATKTVSNATLTTDVTALMSGDNVYHRFTVTADGVISNASNAVMVGADLGADHTGQNLRVTWTRRDSTSTGYLPAGYVPTTWDPSAITGLTGTNTGDAGDRYTLTSGHPVTLTGKDVAGTFTTQSDMTFTGCRISTAGFTLQPSGGVWPRVTLIDCEVIGDTEGLTAQTRTVTDGALSLLGGTTPQILTSATANFTSLDAGRQIAMVAAGVSNADVYCKINSVTDASTVIVTAPGRSVLTGLTVKLGYSNPIAAFSGGPVTVRRCNVYGFGDFIRMSNTGSGDTGYLIEDSYFHDHHDGVAADGQVIDTPHADGVQLFGTGGQTSGTAPTVRGDVTDPSANIIRRNTFDCRYPDSYNPGHQGFSPRTAQTHGGNVGSAFFYGTTLGNIACDTFYLDNIVDGGGYPISNVQGTDWTYWAYYRRNRVGLHNIFNANPVNLDGPGGRNRFGSPASGYGGVYWDSSNVWDLTGTRVHSISAFPYSITSGNSVTADVALPYSAI